MKGMQRQHRGFTVIEIMFVIVVLCLGAWLFYYEKSRVDQATHDAERKVAINAMYYNLEEVFYEKNRYYPATIDSKTLRAMDPDLFTDPDGYKLGEANANYRYEGTGCDTNGHCSGYTLRTILTHEADYIKTNRNKP